MTMSHLKDISLREINAKFENLQPLFTLPQVICIDLYKSTLIDGDLVPLLSKFTHPNMEKIIAPSGTRDFFFLK